MLASIGSARKSNGRAMVVPRLGQRRPGQVAGVFGAAVALAMALSACTSAQPSGSTAAGGSRPVLPARDVLRVADGAKRADGQHSVP